MKTPKIEYVIVEAIAAPKIEYLGIKKIFRTTLNKTQKRNILRKLIGVLSLAKNG